jgi:hypothetical protein
MNTIAASNSILSASAITTAKFFRYNMFNDTIEGSELNFKKAGNPTSEQYAELMQFKAFQPTFKFAPIASTKKVEKKQTYKGLNFELMMDYVEFKGNEIQKAEFEEIVSSNATYPTIKSWFLDNFKVGFTVEKATREIAQHKLGERKDKVRAAVRVKPVKAAPAVVNF